MGETRTRARGARKVTAKRSDEPVTAGASAFLSAPKVKVRRAGARGPGLPFQEWWAPLEPDRYHEGVERAVDTIDSSQSQQRQNAVRFNRLYSNHEATSPYSAGLLNAGGAGGGSGNRVTFNVIQSVIDAVAAKIAKDQPKVSFVTSGAEDYFLKLRAQKLTKYVGGVFKASHVYDNAELVFRDASVVGTGYLKILEDEDAITTEWVPNELVRVDSLDGLKQKPRSMHEIRLMPRDELRHRYPDHVDEINGAQSALQGRGYAMSTVDLVRVVESWHLPVAKGAKDGRHVITIETATLFVEEWEKSYFPIVPFRWMPKALGWSGRSITEEVLTLQEEINDYLRLIAKSCRLVSVPIILLPNGSEIPDDTIADNSVAHIVPYSGNQPPTFLVPTGQNSEVYQHLNSLIQWVFQVVGLSQTSASGMKPAGVDSAVAIREVSDIETGRFALVALRWEAFFVEAARIVVDMSRDLYRDKPDLAVMVRDKKLLHEIRWKDVDLEDNPFDIQTFPTSQLPDTPAGRIQTITEYIQNQWISKEKGMELLNLDPDLEGEVDIQTSSLRLTEKWLSEMVEDGTYHRPDPHMNLTLAQSVAQGVYCQLVNDGCPEDRLQLVRQWIQDIVDLTTAPPPAPDAGAQPPGQPAPPGAPPGGPGQYMPGTDAGSAPMAPAQVPMTQTTQ